VTARAHVLRSAAVALLVVVALATACPWQVSVTGAWTAGSVSYLVGVWIRLLRHDETATARHAVRIDESRAAAEVSLLLSSSASLVAIVLLLVKASEVAGTAKAAYTTLAVVSIVLSWATVHTVYTLRYAQEFFRDPLGGVDFNGAEDPSYRDFAYLAFTIGMTYQVSDTSLTTARMRRLALQHALLSFLFGTAIIATTINVVAGLVR
jgi:uncharacterized membrane protein